MNEHRNITYRLLPEKRENWRWLEETLHAQQQLYNAALQERIDCYRRTGESVSYIDQCKSLTECRRDIPEMAAVPVRIQRGTLKRLDNAYRKFFRERRGFPKFQSRRRFDSFTVAEGARVSDGFLHIPKFGKLRLRGGNPYPDGEVTTVTVRREVGRWYATVCYAVDIGKPDNGKVIGVDMNVGQITDSDGTIHRMPDMTKWERRVLKRQRRLARKKKGSNQRKKAVKSLRKAMRKQRNVRKNWRHQVTREIADRAGTVVIEDLNTSGMTRSAKGTVENPGKNVRAKSGLNREILKTGWAEIRRMLEYKSANCIAVNPPYTSQACNGCGNVDARSRRSQSVYECVSCGHAENADVNAAMNIRGLGIGSKVRARTRIRNGRGGDGIVSGKPDQFGLGSVHDICQEAA